MAYWPGAHGGEYFLYPCGWYAAVPAHHSMPPLPPGRPAPVEMVYLAASSSYSQATVPSGFRNPPPSPCSISPTRRTTAPAALPKLKHCGARALPKDLLENVPPPTRASPPKLTKATLSFDDTTLKEFLEWTDGRLECLSPMASSDLGFDQWTYELRRKAPPSPNQENSLKWRIWELANESPLKLWNAMQLRKLPELLGPGFEWVQTPKNW